MKLKALVPLVCLSLIPAAGFAANQFVTAQVMKAGMDRHGASFELSYVDANEVSHLRWYKAPDAKAGSMLPLAVWAFTRGELVRVELDPDQTEASLGSRPEISSIVLIRSE